MLGILDLIPSIKGAPSSLLAQSLSWGVGWLCLDEEEGSTWALDYR